MSDKKSTTTTDKAAEKKRIEKTVGELSKKLSHEGRIKGVLDAGEIVFKHFFGSKIEAVRQKGRKATSIKQIAEHRDCPFTDRELRVAVEAYVLKLELDEADRKVLTSGKISYSQLEQIVSTPENDRVALFKECVAQKLTVRQLLEAVREMKGAPGGGRSSATQFRSTIETIKKKAQALNDKLAKGPEFDDDLRATLLLDIEESEKLLSAIRMHLSEQAKANGKQSAARKDVKKDGLEALEKLKDGVEDASDTNLSEPPASSATDGDDQEGAVDAPVVGGTESEPTEDGENTVEPRSDEQSSMTPHLDAALETGNFAVPALAKEALLVAEDLAAVMQADSKSRRELAEDIDCAESRISHLLQLTKLPEDVKEAIRAGETEYANKKWCELIKEDAVARDENAAAA